MVDPVWAAVAVGLSGFALWVVTQFQILRAIRLIKSDIDSKRKGTEGFVTARLNALSDALNGAMGNMEGRLRAEIPANADVTSIRADMEAFHQEFVDFGAQIGKDLSELPMKLHLGLARESSIEQKQFQAALTKDAEGVETAMSIRDAMALRDPEAMKLAMMKRVSSLQVTDKYAKEHPFTVMGLEAFKAWFMDIAGGGISGFGSSPSVHVKRLSPGGFQER